MNIIFLIILIIHGLIHLLGFVKAYELADVSQLTQHISKPIGIIWLITTILFLFTAVFFLIKNDSWWMIGAAAIVLSQLLIILSWQDAKFGTIANIIVLVGVVLAYGSCNMNKLVEQERAAILAENKMDNTIVTESMLVDLPKPVQKWIRTTGIVGKEKISQMYLEQRAQMRLKPEQENWSNADVKQYITVTKPAFLWHVNVSMSGLPIEGRDILKDGQGKMLIKLGSLFPVVNVRNNSNVNQSTMQRFLLELPWYPSAALSDYIEWEAIDDKSAKATMTYNGVTGSATYFFNEDGELVKGSAWRYKDNDSDELVECVADLKESKLFDGIKIPTNVEITWMLDEGPYTWYKLNVEDVVFN
ncbi:hypothetical protein EJF36_03125 [Bacillus sp. HMF5848]|uniref:DUF6920 family protein n=1 Tax=Bacillus sp. HMF5848 TaxID=2495421 RepID=UPI000F7984BD|nr:DUF6544 family protein [Bacillus sp. HMF5848]RSK25969.1 hypothetical protein EJF36_03125 [Bacillus sp. HMF5848]